MISMAISVVSVFGITDCLLMTEAPLAPAEVVMTGAPNQGPEGQPIHQVVTATLPGYCADTMYTWVVGLRDHAMMGPLPCVVSEPSG